MNYKYIFGPVPSRRLGISLGVDLVPHKTCTLNCVYCECGRTTNLTLKRKEYTPVELIQEELKAFLSTDPELDFITFSGSGEPTLHSGIGKIVTFLKSDYPQYRIALLTNGTLFYQPHVIEEILDVDLVKVSFDAASHKNFISINRPHPGLELPQIIDGLISLRKKFTKQLWIEVFLVQGFNDSKIELKKIRKVIGLINPDKIQVNTLDRPGAEGWVNRVDKKALTDALAYLSGAEVIGHFNSKQNNKAYKGDDYNGILSTLKRRPCTAEDVSRILNIQVSDVHRYLYTLLENGEIKKIKMPRGIFYAIRNPNREVNHASFSVGRKEQKK